MSEHLDERLGQLLREDAPAERDALFRIGLLERRERQRYQLRQRTLLVSGAVMALLFVAVVTFGPTLSRAGLLRAGVTSVFCMALVLAIAASIRGMRLALRWLRGS